MRSVLERWMPLLWACALLAASLPALAAGRGPQVLVDVEWLQARLGRDDLLLLDASMTPQYAAGHIPGAVGADLYTLGPDALAPAEMQRRLQAWGVAAGRTIVVYDEGGSMMAPRLYWELAYQGVPESQLRLLDGGLARWKARGGAVTTERPAPRPGDLRITARDESLRSRLPEVLAATGDAARHALVDALEPAYYYGGARFFDRAGHLPGARLMPVAEFYNADKTFKSPAEIERMARFLGIGPGQTVHTYCGGGVAAAVPWFALKVLLGWSDVRLYRGSQHEWLRDERSLPTWTYGQPAMRRDPDWLAAWNAPMLRAFGVARIDVIDLRSAEAHRLGHIPGSIPIPAERFREHLADPEGLRPLLAAAGLRPAHEAVIVSDRPLDGRSALAWAMLRRLGHPKVSILTESVDEWALRGHALDKNPTAAPRPGAAAFDLPPRPERMTSPDAAGAGPFERVLLAAGPQAVAARPGSRTVHLPAADLLDAQGRPRPAHEIWRRLVQAGVPRYAELVTVADDPGDAAIAAYLLELMGFADVKAGLR